MTRRCEPASRHRSATRRPWVRVATAALLGVAAAGCEDGRPGGSTRPDVVIIVIDSLRKDHLGSYGHPRPTSPHIDALAAEGIRYTRAYSQAPWTTPSVGSLLTSRYPTSLGIRDTRSPIAEDELLLSEALSAEGYATGAVVSHSFCSAEWGFDQGFDSFDESNVVKHAGVSSAGVADRALDFIAERDADPLFLFLHFFDPHYAYTRHAEFPFADDGSHYRGPIESGMPFLELGAMVDRLRRRDMVELLRIYDSEIAFTDHHIGRVFDALRERGSFDDALIVVTADHGEEFLDHQALGHAKTLYDELVNVPLVIRFPDGESGVVERPVELVDVYPTALAAAGVPAPAGLRGRDLRGLDRETPRPVFSETSRRRELRAVIDGDEKLVYDLDSHRYTLFDLAEDPFERRDVRLRDPARTLSLLRTLKEWLKSNPPPVAPATEVDLSEDEAERLRTLGYLE